MEFSLLSVLMLTSWSTAEADASNPNPVEYPSIDNDWSWVATTLNIQQTWGDNG